MKKRTILHITECLGSGVLYYVRNITEWQVEEYDVVVAYSTRPETPDNFKNQFDERVSFIRVNGFTREIEPVNDFKAFNTIRRIVRSVNPDIIHLHSTKAGVLGRWAINCRKYKVLYSPHAYSFLMQDCSATKRELYRIIEKLSDRESCLTIADSDGELEASRRVTHNAICIPNGINTKEMDELIGTAKRRVKQSERPRVCISGKVVAQKNPRLFNRIAELCPEYDFIWIGAGPLESELTSGNISITGWVSREDAVVEIMNSDVFLFTSSWESLSIALLEVMYMGIPCVVSACDGNTDIISDGVNGYLCTETSEYVNAIHRLIQGNGEIITRRAFERIIQENNTSVMRTRYKKLFSAYGV